LKIKLAAHVGRRKDEKMEYERFSGRADRQTQQEFIPFIRELAAVSGAVIRQYYLGGVAVEIKGDASPVTVADRRAEEVLRALIMQRYPDHGIIGEEYGEHQPQARYCWVLDPIDGTLAFIANCYIFGTLIALTCDGRPILGCIASPLVGHALIGTGDDAFVGERRVRVRACARLEDATLLTTDHWDVFRYRNGPAFEALSKRARVYRSWGDCHGYFQLATGGADIMLDPDMSAWDIMALVPVIEGAGGRITDWQGRDPIGADSIIASGGPLHDEVVRALNP
jgi:histidinol-phosphatase